MQYTKTCLICQQDKIEKVKVAWLLEPLPVPTRLWESIFMDFITHLPKVGDHETILDAEDQRVQGSLVDRDVNCLSGGEYNEHTSVGRCLPMVVYPNTPNLSYFYILYLV